MSSRLDARSSGFRHEILGLEAIKTAFNSKERAMWFRTAVYFADFAVYPAFLVAAFALTVPRSVLRWRSRQRFSLPAFLPGHSSNI
jgi:hypothetical protein